MKQVLSFLALLACLLPSARAQLVELESVKGQFRIGSGIGVNLNLISTGNFNQAASVIAISPGVQYFPGERIQLSASLPLSYARSVANLNQALLNQKTEIAEAGIKISAGYYQPLGDRFFALVRGNMESQVQWWSTTATPQTGFTSESNTQLVLTPSLSFHLGFRAWEGVYIETTLASLFADYPLIGLQAPGFRPPVQFTFSPIVSGIAVYFSRF